MLITKTKPVGVDIPIESLHKFLYPALKTTWGITNNTDWDCYGRVYRNQTNDGYVPEAYQNGADYKELFFDDTLKVLSFFGVGENTVVKNGNSTAKAFLIFLVSDMRKLKPAITGQVPDEEIRNDVEKLLQMERFGFLMTGVSTGLDNVLKEYSGWKKSDGIKNRDGYPFHCFRIDFDLLYNMNDC